MLLISKLVTFIMNIKCVNYVILQIKRQNNQQNYNYNLIKQLGLPSDYDTMKQMLTLKANQINNETFKTGLDDSKQIFNMSAAKQLIHNNQSIPMIHNIVIKNFNRFRFMILIHSIRDVPQNVDHSKHYYIEMQYIRIKIQNQIRSKIRFLFIYTMKIQGLVHQNQNSKIYYLKELLEENSLKFLVQKIVIQNQIGHYIQHQDLLIEDQLMLQEQNHKIILEFNYQILIIVFVKFYLLNG